ncbi:FGGY-family carbohydrate kinase [Chthonobacter rhizosphaerae]|uniref:FGGY-family carbohydrate kinase n=1 Tax=Chthonobacter rhizosphaerae TaxID=2735553 RepID=UPI0015EEB973|nr:FGGY-family carbohydrate kinase [Chthonobacter rhizosphaerae]
MRDCVIGIDAGGTMTKAALFDLAGNELACARRPNEMLFPGPGFTERDPDRMWRSAAEAVREVLEISGILPSRIAAISVAGYGSGLYVVDRDGRPVRNGIVSTDSRAAQLVDEWRRSGIHDRAAAEIQQRLFNGHSGVLLGWLHRFEPGLLGKSASVTFCKDFLRGRLTGDYSTDPSDAGIAGLIDVEKQDWSRPFFDLAGILPWLDKMPSIGPSEAVVGGVTAGAAAATGLLEGTPVVRGCVDVSAAAMASGVVDQSQLSIVAGTFSINSTLHVSPRLSTLPFIQSPYPLGGFIATEGAATSASNLEWFLRKVLDGEGARAALDGRTIYDVCNELVGRGVDRENGILFFPFLFGGPRSAPAGLLGLRATHELGDVLRAIYEGIVYAHREDVDRLLSGPDAARPTVIRLAGGASRSPIWAQFFADAIGLPVEVPAGGELGALGVAMLAATGVGAYPSLIDAVKAMSHVGSHFEPREATREYHAEKFARYTATTHALADAWGNSSTTKRLNRFTA